jgi:hypothetical protein
MRILSVEEAAAEIKDACETAHDDEDWSPFWFLVGPGVSAPSVPLASGIVADCKKTAKKKHKEPKLGPGASALDQYSAWLEAALPGPTQRQKYLAGLIRNKNVSQANFRLAHLLLNEEPGRTPLPTLVVTTNFDDHLSRSRNFLLF